MRIYYVATPEGEQILIRAQSKQQAVWYVTQGKYTARPATQDDIVDLMRAGAQIETVKDDSQQKLDLS